MTLNEYQMVHRGNAAGGSSAARVAHLGKNAAFLGPKCPHMEVRLRCSQAIPDYIRHYTVVPSYI
jgi:hypothetical protein